MRVSLITAACLLFALASHAQPGTGGPGPGNPSTNVPIDGGASIALAAGAAYAVRRLKQRRRS